MNLRRDSERDYEEQLAELMQAVTCLLREYDGSQNFWLQDYPRGACRITSMIIGSLLLELGYEPLGRWYLVSHQAEPEQTPTYNVSHVWLELRDHGSVIYSIDATADQFPEWEVEPFVAYGRSPLAHRFPTIIFETPMTEVLGANDEEAFATPLAHVRRALSAST